jgi:hypothetical protein
VPLGLIFLLLKGVSMLSVRHKISCIVFFLCSVGGLNSYAEPTSGLITISELRPYIGSDIIYVYIDGVGPCGQQSGSYGIYSINLSSQAGKAAYSAVLAALSAGKKVKLEVIAGACGTHYPGLQSIYIGA